MAPGSWFWICKKRVRTLKALGCTHGCEGGGFTYITTQPLYLMALIVHKDDSSYLNAVDLDTVGTLSWWHTVFYLHCRQEVPPEGSAARLQHSHIHTVRCERHLPDHSTPTNCIELCTLMFFSLGLRIKDYETLILCVPASHAVITVTPGSRSPGLRCHCLWVQRPCTVCSCSPVCQFLLCSESSSDSFSSASFPKLHQSWNKKKVLHVEPGWWHKYTHPCLAMRSMYRCKVFVVCLPRFRSEFESLCCYFLKFEHVIHNNSR